MYLSLQMTTTGFFTANLDDRCFCQLPADIFVPLGITQTWRLLAFLNISSDISIKKQHTGLNLYETV